MNHRERGDRIARRHLLHPDHRAVDLHDAAAGMVALHATDPASVFLGLLARTTSITVGDIERALYDERTLVRVMAMRRTLFVTRVEDAPVAMAACGLRVASTQRTRMLKQLAVGSDIADPAVWLDQTMATTAAVLAEQGERTARELSAEVPALQQRWDPAPNTRWGGPTPVSSRLLSQMAMEGIIERSRPVGRAFTSTRFRWRLADPAVVDAARAIGEEAARIRLLDDWLRTFGPATEDDLVWWSGLTKTMVRAALAELETVPVELDGERGLRLADDAHDEEDTQPSPWVAVLPGLDPTPMGWKRRNFYVGDLAPQLFDNAGNIGPTVWADGRIVGVWAQREDREPAVELLRAIDPVHEELLATELERLRTFVGDVRITPRFRTPLERRIAAGESG